MRILTLDLLTSVGWDHQFPFLNVSKSKELLVLTFFFKNLNDPSGFMKELAVFWGWQYDFSQQNCEKQFHEKLFSTVVIYQN
jgi:hypothetical protein